MTELPSLYPVADKWRSFHWHVQTIDGHDIDAIRQAIACARQVENQPSFIEMRTIKGKNISYMENDNTWHKRTPTIEEVEIARRELEVDA